MWSGLRALVLGAAMVVCGQVGAATYSLAPGTYTIIGPAPIVPVYVELDFWPWLPPFPPATLDPPYVGYEVRADANGLQLSSSYVNQTGSGGCRIVCPPASGYTLAYDLLGSGPPQLQLTGRAYWFVISENYSREEHEIPFKFLVSLPDGYTIDLPSVAVPLGPMYGNLFAAIALVGFASWRRLKLP